MNSCDKECTKTEFYFVCEQTDKVYSFNELYKMPERELDAKQAIQFIKTGEPLFSLLILSEKVINGIKKDIKEILLDTLSTDEICFIIKLCSGNTVYCMDYSRIGQLRVLYGLDYSRIGQLNEQSKQFKYICRFGYKLESGILDIDNGSCS